MNRNKYNKKELDLFVKQYNIKLNYKYTSVTRDSIIEGQCITDECNNDFSKTFRRLKESQGYCEYCMNEFRRNSIQDTIHHKNYKRLLYIKSNLLNPIKNTIFMQLLELKVNAKMKNVTICLKKSIVHLLKKVVIVLFVL